MTKDNVILILIVLLFMLWCYSIWITKSVKTEEEANDKLLHRVRELQRIDKQKCIDLFLNDKI
jgi:hypothetical protein